MLCVQRRCCFGCLKRFSLSKLVNVVHDVIKMDLNIFKLGPKMLFLNLTVFSGLRVAHGQLKKSIHIFLEVRTREYLVVYDKDVQTVQGLF